MSPGTNIKLGYTGNGKGFHAENRLRRFHDEHDLWVGTVLVEERPHFAHRSGRADLGVQHEGRMRLGECLQVVASPTR